MNKALVSELVAQHKQLTEWLKVTKAKADKVKSLIIKETFANPEVGTNKEEVGAVNIKLAIRETYTVDKRGIVDTLKEMERGDKIVDWKPSLVKKEYDVLNDENKALLAPFLTMKHSAPVLSYEGEIYPSKLLGISVVDGAVYSGPNMLTTTEADMLAEGIGLNNAEQLAELLNAVS